MDDAVPAVTSASTFNSGDEAASSTVRRQRVNFDGPSFEQSYRRDPNDSGELTFPEAELYEMLDRRVQARLSQVRTNTQTARLQHIFYKPAALLYQSPSLSSQFPLGGI